MPDQLKQPPGRASGSAQLLGCTSGAAKVAAKQVVYASVGR
jgi:hypothetical protein